MGLVGRVAEAPVSSEHEASRPAPKMRRPRLQQRRNPVLREILLRAEDRKHPGPLGPLFHEGRIPRSRLPEHIRVPQQQTERPPTGLAESDEQPAAGFLRHGVARFYQRQDGVQEIALLADMGVGRVIGVPGHRVERRGHADQAVPIVHVRPPGLQDAAAPRPARTLIHGKDIEDRVSAFGLHPVGQQHLHHVGPFQVLAGDGVDEEALLGGFGAFDGGLRRRVDSTGGGQDRRGEGKHPPGAERFHAGIVEERSGPHKAGRSVRPWVGRLVNLLQPAGRDVRVDLRRREASVTQEFLDGPQVGPALEHVGGE